MCCGCVNKSVDSAVTAANKAYQGGYFCADDDTSPTTDSAGNSCAWYDASPAARCGTVDDENFTAQKKCCSCSKLKLPTTAAALPNFNLPSCVGADGCTFYPDYKDFVTAKNAATADAENPSLGSTIYSYIDIKDWWSETVGSEGLSTPMLISPESIDTQVITGFQAGTWNPRAMQPDYSTWSIKAVSVRALYEGFT